MPGSPRVQVGKAGGPGYVSKDHGRETFREGAGQSRAYEGLTAFASIPRGAGQAEEGNDW